MKGVIGGVLFLAATGVLADTVVQQTTTTAPDPCVNYGTPAAVQACQRGRQAPAGPVPVGAADTTTTYTQTTQPSANPMPAWQQSLQLPVTTSTTSVQTTGTSAAPTWQQALQPSNTVTTTQVQTTAPTNTMPVWEQALQHPPVTTTTEKQSTVVIQK